MSSVFYCLEMINLTNIIDKNRARLVNWLILVLIISISFNLGQWKKEKKVIYWDALHYYSYLPATFIYKDISLEFVKKNPGRYGTTFWPKPTPTGKMVIKTSMGLAFLYAPFFAVGHLIAQLPHISESGFSMPYKFALAFSVIFYLGIGLYFLRKTLKMFFSEWITALTCFTVVIGTNLLHYSTAESTMSHAYNFSLIAIFVYYSIRWYEKSSFKNTIILGLIYGLISLIRPNNGLVIIFFVLWKVTSFKDLKERALFLFKKYNLIVLMIIAFIVVWLPQIIYWKYVTGQYFYFSYGDERFYFLDPQIIKGLFSYRKGWLLYTPVMVIALVGIPFLWKRQKEFFYPVLVYTVLNIYIIFSWWAWWYGGGFGQRALIDSYAILAIPFAAFISWCFEQKIFYKILTLFVVFFFVAHNVFQTQQYFNNAIHWDSMTKEAYWETFGKLKPTYKFWDLLELPDYDGEKYRGDKDKEDISKNLNE